MATINNDKIIKQLKEIAMAEAYQLQLEDQQYINYSFEKRFNELVNIEYDSRLNYTISRNVKNARFYDSNANLNDVNYRPDRKLNKGLIEE